MKTEIGLVYHLDQFHGFCTRINEVRFFGSQRFHADLHAAIGYSRKTRSEYLGRILESLLPRHALFEISLNG